MSQRSVVIPFDLLAGYSDSPAIDIMPIMLSINE
jgi:hypothetical protein